MAVVKCTKCGKVFNTEGAILKPIGDGGYFECCPKCGSTSVYCVDGFQSDDDRKWEGYQERGTVNLVRQQKHRDDSAASVCLVTAQ